MRVNDNTANPLAGPGVDGTQRSHQSQGVGGAGGQGPRGPVEKSGGDSVQLSSLGQALQAEELRASDIESPERQQRVAQLNKDVKSGIYQIDAENLSRKIIDDALAGRLG